MSVGWIYCVDGRTELLGSHMFVGIKILVAWHCKSALACVSFLRIVERMLLKDLKDGRPERSR